MTTPYTRLSLDRGQWQVVKSQILCERPYAARVAIALAIHLARLHETRGDYFSVLDELDFLEGFGGRSTSLTRHEAQFTMPPLDRFWHKHYSSARHIPRNIADQWGLSRGGAGNEGLDRLIDDAVNKLGDTPGALASYIAHELVVGGYEKRALRSDPRQREAKLTGNWIILGKHGGQRYYLALATHEAGERPFHLYDSLVKSCAAEFPFLFE